MDWLVNGEPDAVVSADDRGLAYGDGLFETIAFRRGECRFLEAHLGRLRTSCERLMLPLPDTRILCAEIRRVATRPDGTVKIIYTRGRGRRGYALPATTAATRLVGFGAETPTRSPAAGVRIRVCATRLGRNPALAGMKTLNCLEQVLARAEWQDDGIAEGLMLDDRDHIRCGTMSNVFAVCGDGLLTPPVDDAGVSGIMRAQVIEVASAAGIPVRIAPFPLTRLGDVDDLFLTNARVGILPVAAVAGRALQRSAVTMELRALLVSKGVTECAD